MATALRGSTPRTIARALLTRLLGTHRPFCCLKDGRCTTLRNGVAQLPIDSRQIGHFRRLWQSASLRLCADGASNRLLDAFGPVAFDDQNAEKSIQLPDVILGDLDSIRPDTRQFFESKGVAVHVRPSQYATDLQKTIQEVEDREEASADGSEHTLIIFGGLAGRLDQSVHTLHVLWQLAPGTEELGSVIDPDEPNDRGNKLRKRQRTFAIGDGSVAWLLPKANTRSRWIVKSWARRAASCLLVWGIREQR